MSLPNNMLEKRIFFGIKSGRNTDKFEETGLTPIKSMIVDAPYIEEFSMVLECNVIHFYEIGLHTQFIGEIKDVKVNEDVLTEDGDPDIAKIRPLIFCPNVGEYRSVGESVAKAFQAGREKK